jgi:hypothetical protein
MLIDGFLFLSGIWSVGAFVSLLTRRFAKDKNDMIWSAFFMALGCLIICLSGSEGIVMQSWVNPIEVRQFSFNLGLGIAFSGIFIPFIRLMPSRFFSMSPYAAIIGFEILIIYIRIIHQLG